MTYNEIKKSLAYKSDRGCCTVVASSIALGVPFKEMQSYFFKHGRKRNRGYHYNFIIDKLARDYNCKINLIYKLEKDNSYIYSNSGEVFLRGVSLTPNNCTNYLSSGTYVLGTSGHVLAVKDGVVEDWTRGRKQRVKRIWEFIKKDKNVKNLTFKESLFGTKIKFNFSKKYGKI
jgi:hypothetical protein